MHTKGITSDITKLTGGTPATLHAVGAAEAADAALRAARGQGLMRAQRLEEELKDAERGLYESRAEVHAVVALYRDLNTIRWAAVAPDEIKAFEDAMRATISEAAARAREYTEAVADCDTALAEVRKTRAAVAKTIDANEGRNGTT